MNKTLAALAALNEMHDQRRLQYRNHVQHLRQMRLQRQRSAVEREYGKSPAVASCVDAAPLEGPQGGAA